MTTEQQATPTSDEEQLDKILDNVFGYLEVGDAGIHGTDEEHRLALKQALLAWHQQQLEDAGHFFVEKKMRGGAIDYGYYWFCKCGYKANGSDELDGHIKWQLAQLKEEQSDIR